MSQMSGKRRRSLLLTRRTRTRNMVMLRPWYGKHNFLLSVPPHSPFLGVCSSPNLLPQCCMGQSMAYRGYNSSASHSPQEIDLLPAADLSYISAIRHCTNVLSCRLCTTAAPLASAIAPRPQKLVSSNAGADPVRGLPCMSFSPLLNQSRELMRP